MKYYHVSFDIELEKEFIPRIPRVKSIPEDQTIPRICFSPSVGQCLQALPYTARDNIKKGAKFVIFEIDSSEFEEGCWVSNRDIVKFNFVFDAAETGEVWITKPMKLTGRLCELDNFTCEPYVLFSRLKPKDVIDTALTLESSIDCLVDNAADAEKVCHAIIQYAEERGCYTVVDNLLEELGMRFKYVQTWKFSSINYHYVDKTLCTTSIFK